MMIGVGTTGTHSTPLFSTVTGLETVRSRSPSLVPIRSGMDTVGSHTPSLFPTSMDVIVCPSDVKKKVWFYIALYPVHWTAQSALHFSSPGRPVHSDTNSASPGSILAMQQLRNDYSLTFPPLSIARYSFIQLSRLRRREVKENAQTSKRYQRGFEPGLSRLRVRHSTTEPPRSTNDVSGQPFRFFVYMCNVTRLSWLLFSLYSRSTTSYGSFSNCVVSLFILLWLRITLSPTSI